MSNKYPVMVDLAVNDLTTGVANQTTEQEKVIVVNPAGSGLTMRFSNDLLGKTINVACMDMLGRLQMQTVICPSDAIIQLPCTLTPGLYYLRLATDTRIITQTIITKQ